jgi:predicted alpha/beta superfamily hydrolase
MFKHYKYIALLFVALFCIWGCKDATPSTQNSVTIILNSDVPLDPSQEVFISGDFEGWTGGQEKFKLKAKDNSFQISLPDSLGDLQFKFTLGSWQTVERDVNDNESRNRTYQFSRPNDTLLVNVENWASLENSKPLVLPENLSILSDSIYMPQLNRYRRVWVYTPSHYENSNKRYPVVYMHDAQNLFMDETSGFGEWKVDETVNALSKLNALDVIVVGIDHGEEFRLSEYSPYNYKYAENPEGDAYLDFVVNTLKPRIDSSYRTLPDKANTAMIGSSLGGLISHYAGFKYPDTFGKIGVFSPSYWLSEDIYSLLKSNQPKLYLLTGTEEGYSSLSDTRRMKDSLLQNGFNETNFYYKEVEGGKHNEIFWSASLAEALCWLFDKPIPNKNPLLNEVQLKPQPEIHLSSGKILRMDNFPSKYIKTRPIDVWLPETYSAENTYSVLYMHDGQMLFDASTTWNKQEWKVDEWASKLISSGKVDDFIVVAIHNIPDIRWQDLFPQKAFGFLSEEDKKTVKNIGGSLNFSLNGDNYLRFVVNELKPFIDSKFSTKPDKQHTFVMGSSMGGLMSMYAISEYPQVFEGAACLSTHWVGAQVVEDNPFPEAIFSYMENNLPEAGNHRLYFDYGDKTLDEHYPQYAPRVNEILTQKGYTDKDSKNLFFKGEGHSEDAWNKRLDQPLEFLLVKK